MLTLGPVIEILHVEGLDRENKLIYDSYNRIISIIKHCKDCKRELHGTRGFIVLSLEISGMHEKCQHG